MTDVVFLVMICCTVIIPISALFPTTRIVLKKAQKLQTAIFVAKIQINKRRLAFPTDLLDPSAGPIPTAITPRIYNSQITIENVPFAVEEDIYLIQARPLAQPPIGGPTQEAAVIDDVVTVHEGTATVTLSTRLCKDVADMQKL